MSHIFLPLLLSWKRFAPLVLLVFILPINVHAAERNDTLFWMAYYGNSASAEDMASFDLLVLNSDLHLPLKSIPTEKVVLAYLSLGEVAHHRDYFETLKQAGILVRENENWEGSHWIDVRAPLWKTLLLERLIPAILAQGFDGLFFDTLDYPPHLERINPKDYAGMRQASINLVKDIRSAYPGIKLMMNRGYDILDEVAEDLDMVLGESVYSRYDFERKLYSHLPKPEYLLQVDILKRAQKVSPDLQVMTLDYWDPKDKSGIEAIYTEQRKNGFSPYVATIDLTTIIAPSLAGGVE